MATHGPVVARTGRAGSDLRKALHHIVRQASGFTHVASNPGGDQDEIVGVCWAAANSGQAVAIAWKGEAKVIAGGTCTAGGLLTTNGLGRAVDATSGDFTVGMALEAASADGEFIRMLLRIPAVQMPSSLNI